MIRVAKFSDDTLLVRGLFREYAEDLGMDLGFQSFEDELATLPGRYAEPCGRVWIAERDREAVGCAGVRPLDNRVCELKRMFIRPGARGHGLGASLLDAAIAFARSGGYTELKLDTDPSLAAAMHLYELRGFAPCERYNNDPHECTVFMSLALG